MKKVEIRILGMGCPECIRLGENVKRAARDLGLDCEIVMFMGVYEFRRFGMPMTTPALIIDGRIEITGKAVSVEEIKDLLLKRVPIPG